MGRRQVGPDGGRDLAVLQEAVERFATGIGNDRNRLERRQHGRAAVPGRRLHGALDPLDGRKVNAMLML
jgi:hypothetical protein